MMPDSGSAHEHVEVQGNSTPENSFFVSTDRTVYPLESVIHVQASISAPVMGEVITFEILDHERKSLMKEAVTLSPDTMTAPDTNIFEADFEMKGDAWRVGSQYIARGTYRKSFEEDAFTIDRRAPVIQTDKGVYVIGSHMIVTVIDPDADKDNSRIDHVGNRRDSMLTIESDHGRISGYRLPETGISTGIFQGIVRILGVGRDGAVVPLDTGSGIVDRTQGHGGDDGYIGARPGGRITIRYQNDFKVASVQCVVSRFEAAVELDSDSYKPGDTVRLIVIDPDHDYAVPDAHREVATVNIRTAVGSLDDYRLAEIGPGAGVYAGEFRLRECPDASSTAGDGLPDGTLCCLAEDTIEVAYVAFLDEVVTVRAPIRA